MTAANSKVMPSRQSIFLIASLAANAVLLGVVGGRLLSPVQPHAPTMQMQLERYGPTSDVVNEAWAQLPEADRVELSKQLQASWFAMEDDERKQLSEAGQRVHEAALADPFDEGRLREAVAIFQLRENRLQQAAEDILIHHLARMPAQARATAATGLLTPFNARVQEAVDKERAAQEEADASTGAGASPSPAGASDKRAISN